MAIRMQVTTSEDDHARAQAWRLTGSVGTWPNASSMLCDAAPPPIEPVSAADREHAWATGQAFAVLR